jgi:hypothetical protein
VVLSRELEGIITKILAHQIHHYWINVHNIFNEEDWIQATTSNCHFQFVLYNQPTQLPNTNGNNLGFFTLLQADTCKIKRGNGIDGLIANVEKAFTEYDYLDEFYLL